MSPRLSLYLKHVDLDPSGANKRTWKAIFDSLLQISVLKNLMIEGLREDLCLYENDSMG